MAVEFFLRSNSPSPSFVPTGWPYIVLALAVLLAYANVYGNAFLFDDDSLITNNPALLSWNSLGLLFLSPLPLHAGPAEFYRPLQMVLYLIIYQLAGPSTVAFHLLNVVLHMANALLLFQLGMRLGFKQKIAFLAALIWALHPAHVEAVTYMSATADTLYVTFVLIGLCIVLKGISKTRVAMAVLVFLIAMLAKETAIVFPALLAICLLYRGMSLKDEKFYFILLPFIAAAVTYLIFRFYVITPQGVDFFPPNPPPATLAYTKHIGPRILTFMAEIPTYVQITIWPVGLHMERGFMIAQSLDRLDVLAGIVILAVLLIGACFTGMRRLSPLVFGVAWLAIADLPHTGIFVPLNAYILEHWLYLPLAGFILGLAETLDVWLQKPALKKALKPVTVITCVIVVTFGFLTFTQNEVWANPETFYTNIFRNGENGPRAHCNLGVYYAEHRNLEAAKEQFRAGINAYDIVPDCHFDLAFAYLAGPEKDYVAAETELERTLKLDPGFSRSNKSNFVHIYDWMAKIAQEQHQDGDAQVYRDKAKALKEMSEENP